MILTKLVALRVKNAPLPAELTIEGEPLDTSRFLDSFRFDKREAWPAVNRLVDSIERPLVCEVALSLV